MNHIQKLYCSSKMEYGVILVERGYYSQYSGTTFSTNAFIPIHFKKSLQVIKLIVIYEFIDTQYLFLFHQNFAL